MIAVALGPRCGQLAQIGLIRYARVSKLGRKIYLVLAQGEIDILEGINDQGPNQSTLHTNKG